MRTAWEMHESVWNRRFFCVIEEETAMQAISVENLSKTFRVKKKEKGMAGSIKAILHPQTEKIQAVHGVSLHSR